MTNQKSAKIEVTLDRETKQLLKQIRDLLKKRGVPDVDAEPRSDATVRLVEGTVPPIPATPSVLPLKQRLAVIDDLPDFTD